MKLSFFALTLAGLALVPFSSHAMPGEGRGHVNRLANEVAADAQRSVDAAIALFASQRSSLVIAPVNLTFVPHNEREVEEMLGSLNETHRQIEADLNVVAVRVNEVLALKALMNVKAAAHEFRAAVESEPVYSGRPQRSREALAHLDRETNEMLANPVLRHEEGLYLPLMNDLRRTQQAVQELDSFYQLAERVGYRMAEVHLISRHLDRQLDQLVALTRSEQNGNWQEAELLNRLNRLDEESKNFTRECERLAAQPRNVDIRAELWSQFENLRRRFNHLQQRMYERQNTLPQNVRASFMRADTTFQDLVFAFERQ